MPKLRTRIYAGPSAFSRHRVVAFVFDDAELPWQFDTSSLKRLRATLDTLGPSWLDDYTIAENVSPRLSALQLIAHWSRALLNAKRGVIRAAGATHLPGHPPIMWLGYHNAELTAHAAQLSFNVADLCAKPAPISDQNMKVLAQRIERIKNTSHRRHPDYIARIIMFAAESADIPISSNSLMPRLTQYGWGAKSRHFIEATPTDESYFGFQIAQNKLHTSNALHRMGFPVPKNLSVATPAEAHKAATTLGWPLVVKPQSEGQGRGITVNIKSPEALDAAFKFAQLDKNRPVMIERFIEGDDHRLLVIGGKLVAAARREPPRVTGDGISTLQDLIDVENERRVADPTSRRFLKQLKPTPSLLTTIAAQELTFSSVPAAGQIVALLGNANVSTGGTVTNIMSSLHPAIADMAEAIARNLSLQSVGIDYLTRDITAPWWESGGTVIEINTMPGIDAHVASGVPENEIGQYVLGDLPARIPVAIAIASPENQIRLCAHLTEHRDEWPSSMGIMTHRDTKIGNMVFANSDIPMPTRVAHLLAHQIVEAALICVSPEEVIHFGFPVDHTPLTILDTDAASNAYIHTLATDCSNSVLTTGSDTTIAALVKQLNTTTVKRSHEEVTADRLLTPIDPEMPSIKS